MDVILNEAAGRANPSGRFATGRLRPGYRYRPYVAADGVGHAGGPEVTIRRGQDHDVGAVRLSWP